MSNDIKNYSIAGRYRTARKNLDDLGYKQAFSLDSLPLIELLLVDLSQTKESLKHFQSIAKDNLEACSQLQLAVDPYKCDNAKLVQECNELHRELIEAKESNQKLANDFKKRIRQLENELNDQKKGYSRSIQRIRKLELESANKSKKISELLGKCSKPIVNNARLASRNISSKPLKRSVLEADPFPGVVNTCTTCSTRNVKPCEVDFVTMADQRISYLTDEIAKLKEELFLNNEHIETLKSQLSTREKEVSRLRRMLEGGRPCTSINQDHSCTRSCILDDNFISLQKNKKNLEQQLKEALNKQHEAMKQAVQLAERNEELENELKDFNRITQAVEADCNSTVKENNKKVCRLQQKLEDLMTQVRVLESDLTIQRRESQELRADLEASRLEKSSIQRILESTLEEKKQLNDRINHLTIMESNLNCEITHIQIENESLKRKINEFECTNKILKQKVESNSGILKNIKICNNKVVEKGEKPEANTRKCTKKLIFASKSPDKVTTYQEKRSELRKSMKSRECLCQKEEIDEISQCSLDKRIHEKNVIIDSLQNTLELIETERDHYKNEYMKFKDQFKKDTGKDNENMWSQICELRAQMSEKEHTISKLLREKKDICQEKFNLENKVHNYQSQKSRSSSPCNYCRNNISPLNERKSISSSNKLERLERERDVAKGDVARLIEERDALRERLKLATESHVGERRRLTESLTDAQSRLAQFEQKWRDLVVVQESRRGAMSGLEDQLEDVKEDLRRTKLELTEQRTQYFQLRTLQDQTDQALSDVQGQLVQCENELTSALDKNKNMEREQLEQDNQIQQLRQEINTHRCKVSQLDREKDQLLMDLDEKTEKIAALEKELDYKEQQAIGMEQQVQELVHTKELCIDQVADMDRQKRSTQLEIENLHRELRSVTLEREKAIQQNMRLEDDLAAVSCEVRNMHKELEASKLEAHDLKRQLQTYVCEVRRAEELLSEKENERTEMLNHYKSLSVEASALESNNHSLETEAQEVRGVLQATRDQICDLESKLRDKDCLINRYEDQIAELSQNVATLEIHLQQITDECQRTQDDLRTARDLCMTLEQQKECLSQRLCETSELKTQYELQIEQYKSEQDIFQDQMSRDHSKIDQLEKMLEDSRKETISSQTTSREMQCEVTRMKQKISELQDKLCAESSELRKYQTQAAEYSKQICDLRRQITNERFEKAKLQECGQRCSTIDTTKSNVTHAMNNDSSNNDENDNNYNNYNNSVLCNQCRDNKFNKSKVTFLPENVSAATGQKNYSCTSKSNNIAKYNEENQEVTHNNNLCNNLLSVVKGVNVQNIQKSCCASNNSINGSKSMNDINTTCHINKTLEPKKINLESNFSKQSLNHSCSSKSNESLNFMNCGCQQVKNKKTTQSPCWVLQAINSINKLLEEKEKIINKKVTKTQCTETEAVDELINEERTSDEKASLNCSQKNESGIYTDNSSKSSSTQTEDNCNSILNGSYAHLLQILAEIQQYVENINKYFKTMKEAPKSSCHKSQQCYKCDEELRCSTPNPSNNPSKSQSNSNLLIDTSLPVERLSQLSSSINFETSNLFLTSTPRTSITKSKKSCIPVMTDTPRLSSQEINNKNFESKDNESPGLNINGNLEKTEYKALPYESRDKINKSSKFFKVFKPYKSCMSNYPKIDEETNKNELQSRSIDQRIQDLRNEILDERKLQEQSNKHK